MMYLHITSEGDIEDSLVTIKRLINASSPNSEFESTVNINVRVPTMFWADCFAESLEELVDSLDSNTKDPNNIIGINVTIDHYGSSNAGQ